MLININNINLSNLENPLPEQDYPHQSLNNAKEKI